MGQIEIDEIYVGLNRNGAQYVIPVQAKGGSDKLSPVQTMQDIACCKAKFAELICRPVSAQFMEDGVIALFELTVEAGRVLIVEERHYRLVPSDQIDGDTIIGALELKPERLPAAVRPGRVIGVVSEAAADATGLSRNTLVVAGGGDGQAAGLGVNALGGGRAYLNLGTAVVGGIYSRDYRIGKEWRTMGSCSGDGYYLESSLRAGTFLIDWFTRNVCQAAGNCTLLLRELEAEGAAVGVGSDGLLALPYWGAVMTPYWDSKARGCWIGLSGAHRRGHLYRSLLEGIALEQALVTGMIEGATHIEVKEFIAIGGGAASDLWCRILADATGKLIRRTSTLEASSLGAAVCAAVGAGLYATAEDAANAMCGKAFRDTEPLPENCTRYNDLMRVYVDLYENLRETFAKLEQFRGGKAGQRRDGSGIRRKAAVLKAEGAAPAPEPIK